MGLQKNFLICLLFSTLGLFACNRGPISLRVGNDESPSSDTMNKTLGIVGFAEVNNSVFAKFCIGCHASPKKGPTLVSFEDYKANIDKVLSEVVSRKMPKKNTLTDSEIALVQNWVNQGAPLDGNTSPGGQKPSDGPVKWEQVSREIFAARCTRCHYLNAPHPPDSNEPFPNLEDVAKVRELPEKLIKETIIEKGMPPPPKDWPEGKENPNQLTEDQKLLLSKWIIQGMQ